MSIMKTKIFLDGGDPQETREIIKLLGFLDGQTTNPTLIAKNPEAQAKIAKGEKFSEQEIYDFYKKVVTEISGLIPQGSVSIEVYADQTTPAQKMFEQGREMNKWIPNAHIKFPIIKNGLEAAQRAVSEGMRVNMTLCFTQQQGAAVYSATLGAKKGDVFLSPFVGRLDDLGINGMDFINNTLKMYQPGDGHVEVLVASVRSYEHFKYSLALGADIITAPATIYKQWAQNNLEIPDNNYIYNAGELKPMEYENIELGKNWREYNIKHDLTDKGIERFSNDWNGLIG